MERLNVFWLVISSCHQNKILMLISIPNLIKKQLKLNLISVNMKVYFRLIKMERTFYFVDWQALKYQRRKQPLKNMSMERDSKPDSKNIKLNWSKKKMKNSLTNKKTNKKKERTFKTNKKHHKNKKNNNNKPHQQKLIQSITTKNNTKINKMETTTKQMDIIKNRKKLKRIKNELSFKTIFDLFNVILLSFIYSINSFFYFVWYKLCV